MRAILIEPSTQTVSEVQLRGDGYQEIVALLDCNLMTCALNIGTDGSEPDALYVDDEGLLTNPNPHGYFRLPGLNYPGTLAGKGVIVGTTDEGEDCDALTRLDQIIAAVEWVEHPSAASIEPTITFIPLD